MTETPFATDGSNPYQSPSQSTPEAPDEEQFRFLPVIIGWLVDFTSSLGMGFPMGMMLAVQELARNPRATPAEIMQLAANPPQWFFIASMVLGSLCTAVGGYVTAWLARSLVWKHVFAMSLLSFGVGILMFVFNSGFSNAPKWWQLPLTFVAIPAAFLGGLIRVVTRPQSA